MPAAPAKSATPEAPDVIFYDGGCGLCHGTVRFALRRDRRAVFRAAPIGGETFIAMLPAAERAALPDTVVVRTADGRTHIRSAAVIRILRGLGRGWSVTASLLWIVPRPLRDLGYRGVARIRRRLFAKPGGACPVLPPELRRRLLP